MPDCIISLHLIKYFLIIKENIKQFSQLTKKKWRFSSPVWKETEFGLLEKNLLIWFLLKEHKNNKKAQEKNPNLRGWWFRIIKFSWQK